MGKKKINSVKVEYDGKQFDSLTERDFYIYLLEHQKELGIAEIEVHPSYMLMLPFIVDCLKCNGTGKRTSPKTGRDIKCRTCDGTGDKEREGMTYTADFQTMTSNGRVRVYDVKGWPNDAFPVRKKVFENKFGYRLIEVYKRKGEWVYK